MPNESLQFGPPAPWANAPDTGGDCSCSTVSQADQSMDDVSIWCDERGATTLEWALLLGVFLFPAYMIIRMLLDTLTGHYAMMTTINGLPFP